MASIAVLQTELARVADLKPFPGNARRGDVRLIAESLQAHGQYRALVVNRRTMQVLAGNHTYMALKEVGADEALVGYVDVDEDEARRIALIDNRANDKAGYDEKALIALLQDLDGDYSATGFVDQDLADLLARDSEADIKKGGPEPGDIPREPRTRLGDVYQLGPHRLLCGDATDPKSYEVLLGDERCHLLLTDPPYGIDYRDGGPTATEHKHEAIEGDTLAALAGLLEPSLRCARAVCIAGAAAYVFHSEATGLQFRHALKDAGWDLKQVLIWVKQQHVLGRQDYQWKHEPILYGWNPGAAHHWYGGYSESTVIDDERPLEQLSRDELLHILTMLQVETATSILRENRPARNDVHPTMKPVPLCSRLISNSSSRGQLVLDPFAGSGSTLVAAENLGRTARCIELEPGYCDVIVDRWEDQTGDEAEKLT